MLRSKPPYTRNRWVLWIFTLFVLGGLFTVTRDGSRSSVSAEPMAVPLNYNHPLEYDSDLGMYGQSDHVGLSYPFSAEAKAQPVPGPMAAAFLQEPAEENNLLPVSKQLVHGSSESRDANASMAVDVQNNLWVAYTSFREEQEEVYVRRSAGNGQWEPEIRLSTHPLADFNPKLGTGPNASVWVVWSRQKEGGAWSLMTRRSDGQTWGSEQQLAPDKAYAPVVAFSERTDELWVAWEDWSTGSSMVQSKNWNGSRWSDSHALPGRGMPQQHPRLAYGADGSLWLAYDVVKDQKYDIRLARWAGGRWTVQADPPVIEGHRRSPAMTVDRQGRVWLLPETLVSEPIAVRRAFEGQDVTYNVRPPARALLIWTGSEWKALPPGPAMSSKAATLHVDRAGSLWILARTPGDGTRDFITVGQRYRGSNWYTGSFQKGPWSPAAADARAVDGTDDRRFVLGDKLGSTKEPVALVETENAFYFAWHETHREFTWEPAWTYADGPVDTIVHRLAKETLGYEPAQLVSFDPAYHGTDSNEVAPLPHSDMLHPDDAISFAGEDVNIYYGDLHHHTEYSRDPGVLNGDVESNYRYLRDIRRLDFAGLADHTEHLNEHDWYRIRRAASFYNNGEHFAAFAAFEWTSEFFRNGNYQEGHHNVVHRTDGPEVRFYSASVPESNTPLRLTQRLEEDIASARRKNIESNAFLFPHDPSRWVQPITWSWYNPRIRLLELVQSRGSHEILGGPQRTPLRNDIQQLLGKSAQDGLNRGFRWGFIGSGDHRGRPVAAVYASSGKRKDLFDGLYAKQTFATTGARMRVKLSVNGHPMGTEWRGRETKHRLVVYARGTEPVTLVELWKNGRMLQRWSPEPAVREFTAELQDPSAPYLRENWWYLRVTQQDGELAWSSPVWFVYEGIDPVVITDAGRRQPNYIAPDFRVPIPILMRNQQPQVVRGSLTLTNVPRAWQLDPGPSIGFELPPDSWTTYVWYVRAPAGSIGELKIVPVELVTDYDGGTSERTPLVVVQCPTLLETRGQLSELNDALFLQKDPEILNQWLKAMAARWNIATENGRPDQ